MKLPCIFHVNDLVFDLVEFSSGGVESPWKLATVIHSLLEANFATGDLNENAYISNIDAVVRNIFSFAEQNLDHSVGLHIDRDSSTPDSGTSTSGVVGALRPDLLVFLNSRLLFKGEEKKCGDGNLRKSVDDLKSKTPKWNSRVFGSANFLLCYASAGNTIMFVALAPSNGTDGTTDAYSLSDELDLAKPRDRLIAVMFTLNCFRVMIQQARRCYQTSTVCLHQVLNDNRKNGGVITFCTDRVVKKIIIDEKRTARVKMAYEVLAASGFGLTFSWTESTKRKTPNQVSVTIELQPLCEEAMPRDESSKISAIRCVLLALVALHKANITHNDVRWKNVLLCRNDLWYLIDPDECCEWSVENFRKDIEGVCGLVEGWGDVFDELRSRLTLANNPCEVSSIARSL